MQVKKHFVAVVFLLAALCAVNANAQSQRWHDGMENAFFRLGPILKTVDKHCDTAACHQAVANVRQDIKEARTEFAVGPMNAQSRARIAQKMQKDLFALYIEASKLIGGPVVKPQSFDCNRARPHLRTVSSGITCDEAYAAASALCLTYSAVPGVGPVATAICELAATAAYVGCLERESAQSGS